MTGLQILITAQNKLYATVGRKPKKVITITFNDDVEWMLECAENNAAYGYKGTSLKEINECARQFSTYFGELGSQFCDLIGNIGYARCADDKDYENKQWEALEQWTTQN